LKRPWSEGFLGDSERKLEPYRNPHQVAKISSLWRYGITRGKEFGQFESYLRKKIWLTRCVGFGVRRVFGWTLAVVSKDAAALDRLKHSRIPCQHVALSVNF
jgi:hypothetical protein